MGRREVAAMWHKKSTPVRDRRRSGSGGTDWKGLRIDFQHALVRMRSNWDDSDPGTSLVLRGSGPGRVTTNLAGRP